MSPSPILTRRNFVKTVSLSLAHSTLLGRAWNQILASDVHALTTTIATLRLRLQDFPALQSESGSVRVAVNPVNGNQAPNGTFYPIIINRGPNNVFYALNSRCTHQNCIVEALDPSTNEMPCFCHGSIYAIDGRRISGPAPSALTKYTVTFDGSDLVEVKIPGMAFSLTVVKVQPVTAGATRLQLSFRTFRNVDYEVQYRKTLNDAPVAVQFALTETAAADQMVFTAPSAANVKFFVEADSPAGFYTVAIRPAQI